MLRKLLLHNLSVKIAAFFLALILWAYVTGDSLPVEEQPNIRRSYTNVALEWLNIDDELAITKITEEVDVVLNGNKDVLDEITPRTLRVFVDLRNLGPGRHRLTPVVPDVPKGVSVTSINPAQVEVDLETIESHQMQVEVDVTGSQAEGYIRGEIEIVPDAVFVSGARSYLNQVDRVRTIVNINNADGNLTKVVSVSAVDISGQVVEGVKVTPSLVEVFIPIALPQKEIPVRASLNGTPVYGYAIKQINLYPASVTVKGKEEDLSKIEEIYTEPVDIGNARYSVTKSVSLSGVPEGVEVMHSGKIQVEIMIGPR